MEGIGLKENKCFNILSKIMRNLFLPAYRITNTNTILLIIRNKESIFEETKIETEKIQIVHIHASFFKPSFNYKIHDKISSNCISDIILFLNSIKTNNSQFFIMYKVSCSSGLPLSN